MTVNPLIAYIARLERHIRQLSPRHTEAELAYVIAHLRAEAGITDADLPEALRQQEAA